MQMLGVPTNSFAEFQNRHALAAEVAQVVKVIPHQLALLESAQRGGDHPRGQITPDISKDPRSRESAAPDHYAGTRGLIDHSPRILRRSDIAISDDGNVLHCR